MPHSARADHWAPRKRKEDHGEKSDNAGKGRKRNLLAKQVAGSSRSFPNMVGAGWELLLRTDGTQRHEWKIISWILTKVGYMQA